MASYKQPCVHCGELIERDSRLCPKCGSRSPFGYQCPTCLKPIERGNAVCSGCGRALMRPCFHCGQMTFVGADKCDACGKPLLIRCENKRCNELQFFDVPKCTVCGTVFKKPEKQIDQLIKGAK